MKNIALGAGHRLGTAGKRVLKRFDKNETREWTLNSRVADLVEEGLKKYKGYEIVRLDDRTGRRDVPLSERTNKANKAKADILISIHHNAGINGGSGGGIVVYRYPNSTKTSKKVQKALYDELIKETGLKGNRAVPFAEKNLHMVRESNMTALLIENGFMDSSVDVPIILSQEHAEKSAKAIVSFLVNHLKLKGNGKHKPAPKPTPKPKPPVKDKLAVDGLWGPATTRALQQYFKTTVDGVISGQPRNKSTRNIPSAHFGTSGSQLLRAMQSYYATPVDGYISHPSLLIKKMQTVYGTIDDGMISKPSLLVKELQRRLNNGKL